MNETPEERAGASTASAGQRKAMSAPAEPVPVPVAGKSSPVAWLRRCNGQPEAGILTARAEVEDVPFLAGTRQLRGSLATGLAWHAAGSDFTLQPLTEEQLAAWRDRQAGIPPTQRMGSVGADA